MAAEATKGSAESLLETLLSKMTELGRGKETEEKSSVSELPDDLGEREALLAPARFPARVPIMGTNELFKVLGLAELSKEEREEGINAFAVLFYQWGLYKDGRVLVGLWMLGVLVPRATEAAVKWGKSKKEKELGP